MKTRKLRIDLEITVRELSKAQKLEALAGMDEDLVEECSADGELDETEPFDLAEIVTALFDSDMVQEAFAGSNMFVTFDPDPLVIAAEWVPA